VEVVEVVEPGLTHARQPQEGALVKIAYTIFLEEQPPPQQQQQQQGEEEEVGEPREAQAEAPAPLQPLQPQSSLGGATASTAAPPAPGAAAACSPAAAAAGAAAGAVLERHSGLTLCVGSG
ncbi:hypothetical protein Agub_g1081, partial [Astrephomene gubernaculifera]